MSCQHRHLSAIPGGRFACADTLNCCATFTLSSDREVKFWQQLAHENETLWKETRSRLAPLRAQRDSARDCAVILEQLLAEADERLARRTSKPRLDTEKWVRDV